MYRTAKFRADHIFLQNRNRKNVKKIPNSEQVKANTHAWLARQTFIRILSDGFHAKIVGLCLIHRMVGFELGRVNSFLFVLN
jgi:hypothetical protein